MIRQRLGALLALAALGGCGIDDEASPGNPPEATVEVAPQMDDATYLYRLGLMRGHLFVGNALFDLGEPIAAGTHSKHPTDELYTPMEIEFAARTSAGFATELEAHALAVAEGNADVVEQRYAELLSAIAANESAVEVSSGLAAEVIGRLVAEAAAEYAIGIVDGKPANAHEYQDAYGFTQIAIQWAQRAATDAPTDKPVFHRMAAKLEGLADMWPALVPPRHVPHDASRLYGAAAEIEILALDLDG